MNRLTTQPTLFDPVPDITRRRHRGHANSVAANHLIEPHRKEMTQRIIDHLKKNSQGMTSKELSAELDMRYTTVSGRLSELKRDNLVTETGLRRDGSAVCKLREAA